VSAALQTYSDVVRGVLDIKYRPLRNASKLLARQARVSHRTAENWLAGKNAPNGDALVKLMAHNDELAAEIFALVAEMRAARK